MSYQSSRRPSRKRGRGPSLLGLGGVENCGNDQVWDPNIVVNQGTAYELRGQCMPRSNYSAAQLENAGAYPGVVKTAGGSSSNSGGGGFAALIGGLLANATKPAAPAPYPYPPPSSGMSTGTMLMLGALGLGVIYVATK